MTTETNAVSRISDLTDEEFETMMRAMLSEMPTDGRIRVSAEVVNELLARARMRQLFAGMAIRATELAEVAVDQSRQAIDYAQRLVAVGDIMATWLGSAGNYRAPDHQGSAHAAIVEWNRTKGST